MGGKSRKGREEEKLQRRKEEETQVEEEEKKKKKKKKRHRLTVRNTEKSLYIYTGQFVIVISFLGF